MMKGWPISCSGDDLDYLKQHAPPCVATAFAQLVGCIGDSALVCIDWLLRTYPEVVNCGQWNFNRPLEVCATNTSQYMPDIVLMLLKAGAQHTQPRESVIPGIERGNVLKFFYVRGGRLKREHFLTVCKHLIDYGACPSPLTWETELRDYWSERSARVHACHHAREALWIALRRKHMPRDVVRLVLCAHPLRARLAWKEWGGGGGGGGKGKVKGSK